MMSEEQAIKARPSGWTGVATLAISPVWVPTFIVGVVTVITLCVAASLIACMFAIPFFSFLTVVEWWDSWKVRRRRLKGTA